MNRALFYLWTALLKARAKQAARSLRRPGTLIGFLAVVALIAGLFYLSRFEEAGHVLEPKIIGAAAFVMVCGSLFRGFMQRGLEFEPPDLEFLFTSPFTERQLVLYRLLPNYLYAVLQSFVFCAICYPHLKHPVFSGGCLLLFQIACFHLATGASIFAGSIPEPLHYRLRWMTLGVFFLLAALYLRAAWGLKLAPHFLTSPPAGLLFYPAVTLPDVLSGGGLRDWMPRFANAAGGKWHELGRQGLVLIGFGLAALGSLWALFQLKGHLFEPALATTMQSAERRLRVRQGRSVVTLPRTGATSFGLPRLKMFRGVGAIIWKNLIVARRSKSQLLLAGGFALLYTGFTFALLYLFHYFGSRAPGGIPQDESLKFHLGIALFLAALTFFLQRMAPFDFRRDGNYLLLFRTLPVTPLGIALAEVAVPTVFCLALQAPCLAALVFYARFPALPLTLILLAFPAIALGVNGVWNIHYLLAATKHTNAKAGAPSAVGTVLVVALSFLVFFPAFRIAVWLAAGSQSVAALQRSLAAGLLVQYAIDLLLVLLLGRLFQRFELSRDAV